MADHRIHGVGFAIKNETVRELGPTNAFWSCGLNNNRLATVISAYAPTLHAEEDIKDNFYAYLDQVLTALPMEDTLILLEDSMLWNNIISKEGAGKANSIGILLWSKCAEHDLVITNTLFRQKNLYKTTWMHPRWYLLDSVIVRACDQKDVRITRAMRGTGTFSTDHRPVRSIHEHSPCYQVSTSKNEQEKNTTSDTDVDQQWVAIKSAIHKAYIYRDNRPHRT